MPTGRGKPESVKKLSFVIWLKVTSGDAKRSSVTAAALNRNAHETFLGCLHTEGLLVQAHQAVGFAGQVDACLRICDPTCPRNSVNVL